ncbi:cilia- and flagella-associated protein 61-like [Colias croceus]|uniref:cilia- and flagella-associated protein 61-like n=1 Tax=Colias crocea TaxID=72248 RepID=UPI001E27C673|nr:cilia- and flagella-associated protein 61-like [Colias croceus]
MEEDAPAIMALVNESMSLNFRVKNVWDIKYILKNCVLSICQLDINGTIVGFLSAKDYPLLPSVNPAAWEDFVWTKYKCVELNSRNTLFLHLLCWNPIYARELVDNMLKSLFMHDPYLQYVAMMRTIIECPLLVPGQSRSEASFKRMQALERGVPGDQLPALLVADRSEVSPRLRVRRAVEEDNDDIVPIIERQSTRLRELYGDFYVSELISRHPESERVLLVCEHKEVAVGVMCLNTQINYEELEESFELSPFAGLKRLERIVKPEKEILESNISLLEENKEPVKETSFTSTTSKDVKSRVTWIFEEDEFKKFDKDKEARPVTQPGPYSQLDVLNFFQDEPEEVEYDIVNIDHDLLKVPKFFYEKLGISTDEGFKSHRRESFYDNKYLDQDKGKRTSEFLISPPAKPPQPTRYIGAPNAFLLELFAMHQDYDERYGFDMLQAAYELFPNRDYCIICLPTCHTSFPLLDHFTLVTPQSYRMRFINETLYVAHINSVRGDVRVRAAEPYDIPSVTEVLEHSPRKHEILDLLHDSFVLRILSSFVLLSQNQPIGLVILGALDENTIVRAQYDLPPEPHKYGTDAALLAGVMSPIMEPHARWYLRDLIRHTKYVTLFWACRLFAKGDASPARHLMSLGHFMKPVVPRQFFPNVKGNKDLELIFQPISAPFALWTLERALTSLPRVYVNNNIVVVGASRTGLAFIEQLFMGPTYQYLTFTNITLVSEHGLPTVPDCLKAAETCVPRNGRYTDRYIKSVPFYYYVDVISAVMTQIDRKKKCIHLKDGGMKFYDELVLTCGQQFQHPDYLKDPEPVRDVDPNKPCDRLLMDDTKYQPDRVPPPPELPDNVMLINSLEQANNCLRKLQVMIKAAKESDKCLSEDNRIIVYGDYIEAYSCIAALLEMGISAKLLAFVEPFPPEDSTKMRVNCFNNETVDERVQMMLKKLKIQVYRKSHLYGWWQKGNRVETIRLMSPLHAFHLPCFAFFYYGIKAIDVYAFKAINESGLVYDGGLVVGPSFDTNDPHVFAAGPCVRYSRKLYADIRQHKNYCSEDVGEALARIFLHKLDPFMTGVNEVESPTSDVMPRFSSNLSAFKDSHASVGSAIRLSASAIRGRWQPVAKFKAPLVQSGILPGPLYYMQLRTPGPEIPMAVKLSLPHQGHILITDKHENYFRLQVNALHCIEAITCLSKKRFSSESFTLLYGKHEAYFNNLLARYELHLIDDFYDFFSKPWMSALYQESFIDLISELHEHEVKTVYDVVKTKYYEFVESVESSTCDKTCISNKLMECGQNAELRQEAAAFWRSIGGEHIVTSHLAHYLKRNSVINPYYAVPEPEFT